MQESYHIAVATEKGEIGFKNNKYVDLKQISSERPATVREMLFTVTKKLWKRWKNKLFFIERASDKHIANIPNMFLPIAFDNDNDDVSVVEDMLQWKKNDLTLI
jgi:hypothetical protein